MAASIMTWPILSVTTFLPIVGVLFIAMMRNDEAGNRNIRWVALWTTIVTFAVSLIILSRFDAGSPEFQFVEKREWLGGFATYRMGVDGISVFFVLLSTLLTPVCILASWEAIENRVKEYMISFLVLETLMVGTFSSLDFVALSPHVRIVRIHTTFRAFRLWEWQSEAITNYARRDYVSLLNANSYLKQYGN